MSIAELIITTAVSIVASMAMIHIITLTKLEMGQQIRPVLVFGVGTSAILCSLAGWTAARLQDNIHLELSGEPTATPEEVRADTMRRTSAKLRSSTSRGGEIVSVCRDCSSLDALFSAYEELVGDKEATVRYLVADDISVGRANALRESFSKLRRASKDPRRVQCKIYDPSTGSYGRMLALVNPTDSRELSFMSTVVLDEAYGTLTATGYSEADAARSTFERYWTTASGDCASLASIPRPNGEKGRSVDQSGPSAFSFFRSDLAPRSLPALAESGPSSK